MHGGSKLQAMCVASKVGACRMDCKQDRLQIRWDERIVSCKHGRLYARLVASIVSCKHSRLYARLVASIVGFLKG